MLTRILIVEVERIAAFNLRRRPAEVGHEMPAIATRGEEALRTAQEIIPLLPVIKHLVAFLGNTLYCGDGIVSGSVPVSSGAPRESPGLARSSVCVSRHDPSAGTH